MKTNVKATGIEFTEALSNYVDEKVGSIERFLDSEDETIFCEVEIGKSNKEGGIFRAEINLDTTVGQFRAESEKEDLYVAINDAKEQITEAVKSKRSKKRKNTRKGGGIIKNLLKFGK